MSDYFSKSSVFFRGGGGGVKLELDLSNQTTKAGLKIVTVVHKLKFAKNVDLASLKSKVDKLDVGKLEITSGDVKNIR